MRLLNSKTKDRSPRTIQLRMAPVIDVVFLLLVFFLVTANFRSREGFLPADMPQRLSQGPLLEIEPLPVALRTDEAGRCWVQIGRGEAVAMPGVGDAADFAPLTERLRAVLASQQRRREDPVKLAPTAQTRWDHVVKAYDALWALDLHNIIFAVAE